MAKNLFLILITASVLSIVSCTKPDIQFGQEIATISNTQIVMVDTFTPKLSTVYIDSFITSGKGVGLTGGYTDPVFGSTAAQSYLELAPPSYNKDNSGTTSSPYENTIFDSLTLILKLQKGNYYGDTTQPLQINVHRLSQQITPPNNGSSLYNVNTTPVFSQALGSGSFIIYPSRTDTLAIRLSDQLGLELYNKLKNTNDLDVQNVTNFLQYFYGIRISSPASSNLVLGLKDSVTMRLHYRKVGMFMTNAQSDFTINNTSHHYSNITADKTNTAIAGINSVNREIFSEQTNNVSFLQAATGTMVKIAFPSLGEIGQLPNFAKLMNARLIIKPIMNSYLSYPLPTELRLSVTSTAANALGNDLVYLSSNGSAATQYGNLAIDYLNGTNTSYTYDLTNYIKALIKSNTGYYPGSHDGLLLSPPSNAFETKFNRVIVGDKTNTLGKIELQIYYAAVK